MFKKTLTRYITFTLFVELRGATGIEPSQVFIRASGAGAHLHRQHLPPPLHLHLPTKGQYAVYVLIH